MHRPLASLVLAPLLGLVGACSDGSGGDEGGEEATLARVQAEVFDVGCTAMSCHSAATRAGDLNLEAGSAHAQLVGVAADNPKAAGEGLVRVVPGDPDASFLVRKCRAGLDAAYGGVMPSGNPDGLEADKVALLEAWIAAGAPAE